MSEYAQELRDAINKFTPLLEKMSDEATRGRPTPRDEPATPDYFMEDCVWHLTHHLHQIIKPE